MLVRLPKLACLLLPADFAGNAHFLLDFESCRAFTCSRSPEMIFSTLVLLFCFTWSIRLKTAAAAGHGSARTDQNYGTLDQVKEKLQQVGLESSNLIIGVDFTKSNEWTGKHCFDGRSLHHLGDAPNPYEQAIGIIGRTLSAYDEDNRIPCFGFGDTTTHDRNVFNFYRDGRACNGVSEALQRYREIAPHVRLSGPTSLAPIIETATRIVEASRHQYHILLIIADGQVPTRAGAHSASYPTEARSMNYLEERTLQALIRASNFPLSIVLVGVGDVPWDDRIHCHDMTITGVCSIISR
ncbi:E3 ubiquitin-protein ligase RGLG1-like isoform X2 [Panicum virgatum]|uniref:E3 ubiquitin-protein ligase RGLG1-like isoform X2 n=1 Tax=Panicum virgatum TaxID=38727 RepID=UPI0019D55D3E|nr:E3 ubiquitin-protein ligase RGLG1-like isoform X2 [Panicum virgatum]